MSRTIIIILLPTFVFLAGCSSSIKRTRTTDKGLSVSIYPDNLSSEDYVAIQTALVKTDKFIVLDRKLGFAAAKQEQDRQFITEQERFDDNYKYAHFGRLAGAGSVIWANKNCRLETPWFSQYTRVYRCSLFLNLVDSRTGRVLVAVEGKSDDVPAIAESGSFNKLVNWDDVANKLADEYPKEFIAEYNSEQLIQYQHISAEEAKRKREAASEKDK
jgi:curli biogenesis system outer membrane secretion channel CsgG